MSSRHVFKKKTPLILTYDCLSLLSENLRYHVEGFYTINKPGRLPKMCKLIRYMYREINLQYDICLASSVYISLKEFHLT